MAVKTEYSLHYKSRGKGGPSRHKRKCANPLEMIFPDSRTCFEGLIHAPEEGNILY